MLNIMNEEILKKPWLNMNDMRQIYPCGRKYCYEMMNAAREKAVEENYFIPTCKPPVVPTEVVLELFPLGTKRKG